MLMPKRVKHRKQFRGSMSGKATRGNTITYGEYGIISTEPCWIKANQIEAARVAMTRYISNVVVKFGSKFSQRNQLLINLWVFVWVKERVLQSTG